MYYYYYYCYCYYLEHIRNLLETTLEVLATLHKILDVVDVGEIDLEQGELEGGRNWLCRKIKV